MRRRWIKWTLLALAGLVLLAALGLWGLLWQTRARLAAPQVVGWYFDGTQELVRVARVFPERLGTFLGYHGAWTAVPELTSYFRCFAANGAMIAGPLTPGIQPAEYFLLLKDGQATRLFTGQALMDAAGGPDPQDPPLLKLHNASYDQAGGSVTLTLLSYGTLQHVREEPVLVEYHWDGKRITRLEETGPGAGYRFTGGTARLVVRGRFEQRLQIQLTAGSGEAGALREVDLGAEDQDGFTRIAGLDGGTLWLVNALKQTAARRDLATWRILERRSLQPILHRIPRELLDGMQRVQSAPPAQD